MRNELNYMNNANRNDLLWSEHYRCEGMCAGSTCRARMVWKLSLISKLEKYCRCFLWKKIQFSFTSQLKVCSKGSNCIVSVGSSNFSHWAGNNFSKQCWPKRELGHTELIGNWYAVVIPRHFFMPWSQKRSQKQFRNELHETQTIMPWYSSIAQYHYDLLTVPWKARQKSDKFDFQIWFWQVIFAHFLGNCDGMDAKDLKSILVQVMAWCRLATSHKFNRCWPMSVLPCGATWGLTITMFVEKYFENGNN